MPALLLDIKSRRVARSLEADALSGTHPPSAASSANVRPRLKPCPPARHPLFPLRSGFGPKAATLQIPVVFPEHPTTEPDAYLCTAVPLPDRPLKLVGVEPTSDEEFVHHMLLFGATVRLRVWLRREQGDADRPPAFSDSSSPRRSLPSHHPGCKVPAQQKLVWPCKMTAACGQGGESVLYGWGKNANAIALPDGVGYSVGPGTGVQALVLQVRGASPCRRQHSGCCCWLLLLAGGGVVVLLDAAAGCCCWMLLLMSIREVMMVMPLPAQAAAAAAATATATCGRSPLYPAHSSPPPQMHFLVLRPPNDKSGSGLTLHLGEQPVPYSAGMIAYAGGCVCCAAEQGRTGTPIGYASPTGAVPHAWAVLLPPCKARRSSNVMPTATAVRAVQPASACRLDSPPS